MSELNGRVALVTGASRGLGAAAARALAAEGARVIVTDIADASAVADEIGGIALTHDVTSEEDWARVIGVAKEEAGGLDILVNNAGLFIMRPLLETTLDDWRRLHAVNCEGVFLGCRAAVPLMAERAQQWPGGASIINLSSVAGLRGSPGVSCYNSTKGAVRLFTKGIALELAASRIRVNSIHPGVIDTDMGTDLIHQFSGVWGVGNNEGRDQVAGLHPLGRLGAPVDIANAVAFLASDRSAFMTGSEVVVDGGMTAR
ncbi:SDR family oxidoreductase [Sphingomonas lacunae]|uniref:SDR family oxidoreductase n=2 Tax=Sphingomonas lacunae TaxID=2698828 RepID=A0A6M4AWC9_9SPHN|nr:SDR family oxidoreductase [Sphingomonas lacunae]